MAFSLEVLMVNLAARRANVQILGADDARENNDVGISEVYCLPKAPALPISSNEKLGHILV